MSGKAPGVQVTSGGGQPGAAGKVVIRGKSTVNGSTDPLWIVDGVIVGTDAGSLNPADIESMSILKDAASTAIYGSQGANGVIVVTTKKGKIGKATINASVKMGVNQLHRGNMNMMNGEELYDYYKSFANQDALPSYFTEDLRNRNFDWWKEGTHLGFAQDYNVSVSGVSEKIKTYTSCGYYNEDGAVKGYDYIRYNLRFNVDYQATDWLTIKPKVWATRIDVMDQQQDLGAIMYVNFPWDSPYDENGDLIQQYRPTDWVNSDATNYLYDLQWNYEKKTSYEFMGNFDFDIKFTDWLTFASVNSYKYNNILFKGYNDPRSKAGEADNGLLQDKTTTSYRVYSNQLLRFNKVFDKHSINAILAYEWNSYTREIKDQTAASFAPGFSVADVATTPKTIKGSQEEWAVQSYLFNANYAYDNRYLLSFSFRRDGASNFGEDAKYGNFFSVSGGWNIHQEEFFKANGRFAAECYKNEIETAMRSEKLAGFQLLDIQDFPGQGTALVGILNSFMESKGFITPEKWRGFCSDKILLANFKSYVITDKRFTASIYARCYKPEGFKDDYIRWEISDGGRTAGGGELVADGNKTGLFKIGAVNWNIPEDYKTPKKLTLTLTAKNTENSYDLWYFPELKSWNPADGNRIIVTDSTDTAVKTLREGGNVLLASENLKNYVEGTYCTDFWCYPMFKAISEQMNKPVPVGTLGLLIDNSHKALKDFASEYYSTPQWYNIVKSGVCAVLDDAPKDFYPIVQTIDNIERNHKLGNLFEANVLNGKLIVCTMSLRRLFESIEGKWFVKSVCDYCGSESFNPKYRLDEEYIRSIFI